ncbi:hypothetical protein ACVBEH_20190 [Roseateles sp. GG27B]
MAAFGNANPLQRLKLLFLIRLLLKGKIILKIFLNDLFNDVCHLAMTRINLGELNNVGQKEMAFNRGVQNTTG